MLEEGVGPRVVGGADDGEVVAVGVRPNIPCPDGEIKGEGEVRSLRGEDVVAMAGDTRCPGVGDGKIHML